jgi:site-specific DNA-adenine methylase
MSGNLRPPFSWFGGKRLIAAEVWRRFGPHIFRYAEPFAGGLAVALAAPRVPYYEIYNDIDGLLVNAWRAIQRDPRGVWQAADRPMAELELQAIHARMMVRAEGLAARLAADPDYYDAEMGGWWVWGQCATIGDHWVQDRMSRSVPRLVGFPGLLSIRASGNGPAYLRALSRRLSRSVILCGDWMRAVTPIVLFRRASPTNVVAVFLDPPYAAATGQRYKVYGRHDDGEVAHRVREWALEHGDDPRLRIALCGYNEHDDLAAAGWQLHRWSANGGYGNIGSNGDQRHREVVWFSPRCVRPAQQLSLFDGVILGQQ